jgi:hypothetical protein
VSLCSVAGRQNRDDQRAFSFQGTSNNTSLDDSYQLKHGYEVPLTLAQRMQKERKLETWDFAQINNDEALVFIADELGRKIDGATLHTLTQPAPSTLENFGPFTLAADEYYVLGDSRQQVMDSRHFGPIKGKDVIGKVFD